MDIPELVKQVMHIMADIAEEIPMKYHRGDADIPVVFKPDGTPVTEADSATEYRLIEELTKLLPGSQVIGEETVGDGDAWRQSPLLEDKGNVWIVDPIDGTFYFYRKQPFGMLIGLRQGGEMTMAVAYYPQEREFLWAARETVGAFHCLMEKNTLSAPRHVALPAQDISQTELGYFVGVDGKLEEIISPAVLAQFSGVQTSLCVATALRRMLMQGGYACLYGNYKPWDFETTGLIARQAGADVTHFDGTQSRTTPAARNVIFTPTPAISRVIHGGMQRVGLMQSPVLPVSTP